MDFRLASDSLRNLALTPLPLKTGFLYVAKGDLKMEIWPQSPECWIHHRIGVNLLPLFS